MIKKVAAINDLSGFGKCSLTVAIPILSVLGVQCCPLPTAVLSSQTGFPSYFIDDYTDNIDKITDEWGKLNIKFDGIYTGFLASEKQVDKIITFLDKFMSDDTVLLVDPVMGDDGKVYSTCTPSLCVKMKFLAAKASIITPNLTEACLLTDIDYNDFIKDNHSASYFTSIQEIGQKLISKGTETVVITGIHCYSDDDSEKYIYNAAINKHDIYFSKSEISGQSYSGTGDIFASIICGYILNGKSINYALQKASLFVENAIRDTHKHNTDRNFGVNFEKFLYLLTED